MNQACLLLGPRKVRGLLWGGGCCFHYFFAVLMIEPRDLVLDQHFDLELHLKIILVYFESKSCQIVQVDLEI